MKTTENLTLPEKALLILLEAVSEADRIYNQTGVQPRRAFVSLFDLGVLPSFEGCDFTFGGLSFRGTSLVEQGKIYLGVNG